MNYTVAEAVKVAKSQEGKHETGTNDTPYNRWLGTIPGYPHGGYGYPWCMSFQSWVAFQAGARANVDYPKTAGCAVAVAWFKNRGRFHSSPKAGDMVFYGPGGGTHVELVIKVTASTITTVGGNTGGTLDGRYHEGNGVYIKTVSRRSPRIYGFGRPVYAAASQEDDMPLSNEDLEKIRKVVWETDKAPAPAGSDPKNPTWQYVNVMRDTYTSVQQVKALVTAIAGQSPDVDEAAIVAGVVDALPDNLATQVLDGLKARLEA